MSRKLPPPVPAALDHLKEEAGAPLRVLDGLRASRRPRPASRSSAGRPWNSPSAGSSICSAARSIAAGAAASSCPGRAPRPRRSARVDHVAREREGRVLRVAGLGQVLELRRLQLLEAGVGEPGDLLVVAGQHHGVAGEVGRLAVVVEVVEVGEQQRRPARVHVLAGQLPGASGVLVGAQPQRRAGQLEEVLLQPRRSPVGEARRRLPVEREVEEAGAGAQPERHLLADLAAVEGEQVAQRGRAAVVARARAGSRGPSPVGRSRHLADWRIAPRSRSFRYSARSREALAHLRGQLLEELLRGRSSR